MTNRSLLLNLGRAGAVAAATVAIVGLAACFKPAPPANNTAATANAAATRTAATNGAGLGSSTTVPGAPVLPAGNQLGPGQSMSGPMGGPAGMNGPGGPGGPGGGPAGGPSGGPGGSTGMSGPGGQAPGGYAQGGPGGQDQTANDDYDKNFINSCFRTAVQNGNSTQSAARYCACAMGELDQLSLRQKQGLTGNSPEVRRAEQDCQRG
jgi:hypothetical protein